MINDEIRKYADKLDVRFARNNIIKMLQTLKRVRKYVAEELAGNDNAQFDSQDLRVWAISIDKTLKAVNKKISFVQYYKNYGKYEKITRKEMFLEIDKNAEYIRLAQDLEFIYSNLCNIATTMLLIEMDKQQTTIKSDKEFQKAILNALEEIKSDNGMRAIK